MADDTTLPTASGGDIIRTDALVSEATGLEFAKAQAVKIILGGSGIDGGFLARDNPLPVSDIQVTKRLDTIITLLRRIVAAVEQETL